jgi:hypothetical protein
MIGLSIIHFAFIVVAACLVYRVYKLVKFKDLPILLSIGSVLCSLLSTFSLSLTTHTLSVMFIWVICFFMFIRTDKTSVLHNTNLMRMINFTATMFFGCALIFDLYKW